MNHKLCFWLHMIICFLCWIGLLQLRGLYASLASSYTNYRQLVINKSLVSYKLSLRAEKQIKICKIFDALCKILCWLLGHDIDIEKPDQCNIELSVSRSVFQPNFYFNLISEILQCSRIYDLCKELCKTLHLLVGLNCSRVRVTNT